AADIMSDVDSPPFDKSQMDGFAVRAADTDSPPTTLRVVEEITAGRVPQNNVNAGEAARIMTGAPIPPGADAVVPIEQCEFVEGSDSVTVRTSATAGAYIIPRGQSMAKGEVVLRAGTRLAAPQLGLLAELGRAQLPV